MLAAAITLPLHAQTAGPVKVQVEKTAAGYRLLRGGQPYSIKGGGGTSNLEQLRAAGGNSIRTWGSDNLAPLLDRAQKLGLTVTVGIWLGQERQGFRYDDPKQIAEQYERARQAVLRYKDHPALLMWGLGNEMEGDRGDNPAIWNAIEAIAKMAKQTDPNHPMMTVIAEIGGEKIPNLHRLCPNIDVVGINSYGGAPSVAERYRKLGGTKPYVLTEFGPTGSWEVAKTSWGARRSSRGSSSISQAKRMPDARNASSSRYRRLPSTDATSDSCG